MSLRRLLNPTGTLCRGSRSGWFSVQQCALVRPWPRSDVHGSVSALGTCAWRSVHCCSVYQKRAYAGINPLFAVRTLHVSCASDAGHNKWSKIKRKKAVTDLGKSKARAKLLFQIRAAVVSGGNDPSTNIRLSSLLTQARSSGVPKSGIESALKSGGTGTDDVVRETALYEGKGPSRYLVLIETLTDNRNRTRSQIRRIIEQQGGVLGEPGSSAFMFEQRAIIQLTSQSLSQDPLELAIEVGAEDVNIETDEGDTVTLQLKCEVSELNAVCSAIRDRGLEVSSTSLEYLPKSFKYLTREQFDKAERLVELLNEQSDVVAVYSNHELS